MSQTDWILFSFIVILLAWFCLRMSLKPEYELEGHNIAIGVQAGKDWTDEKYMFAFTVPNKDGTYKEYSTKMTPSEYKKIYNVINRSLLNKKELPAIIEY